MNERKSILLVQKARRFARKRHRGQLDDDKLSYFDVHVRIVGDIIKKVARDPEIVAAAYLHDTLEDTDTTYEELKKEFSERVAELVFELTHLGTKESGYISPNLKSRDAIMIKFADRLSNISRMGSWSKEEQD